MATVGRRAAKYIELLYAGRKARVITDYGLTEPYNIGRGISQGDPLSCVLFILYSWKPFCGGCVRRTLVVVVVVVVPYEGRSLRPHPPVGIAFYSRLQKKEPTKKKARKVPEGLAPTVPQRGETPRGTTPRVVKRRTRAMQTEEAEWTE